MFYFRFATSHLVCPCCLYTLEERECVVLLGCVCQCECMAMNEVTRLRDCVIAWWKLSVSVLTDVGQDSYIRNDKHRNRQVARYVERK